VESAVADEIAAAVEVRPGLAAIAFNLAQLLDNPRAASRHAAAAKVLVGVLADLGKVGAPRRRSGLSVVRQMTEKGGA
jgi:hypothetical protein